MTIKRIAFKIFLGVITISCINTTAKSQLMNRQNYVDSMPDTYNVDWNVQGPTSSQSMPVGNGDIGLNVWTEPNGDLCFYIGKTDAWGAASDTEKNNWIKDGG